MKLSQLVRYVLVAFLLTLFCIPVLGQGGGMNLDSMDAYQEMQLKREHPELTQCNHISTYARAHGLKGLVCEIHNERWSTNPYGISSVIYEMNICCSDADPGTSPEETTWARFRRAPVSTKVAVCAAVWVCLWAFLRLTMFRRIFRRMNTGAQCPWPSNQETWVHVTEQGKVYFMGLDMGVGESICVGLNRETGEWERIDNENHKQ